MRTLWIYLQLELKRVCKILPQFLMGAIVLAFLLGAIALSASRALYGETAVGRISVGVVLPPGDSTSQMAVGILEKMDSVKSLCDFVYLEEEEGLEKLRAGELYGVLKIPRDFVQGIINGTNIPITILLPEAPGVETQIFKELADAGARTLGTAQAAIYAADDFCVLEGMTDSISQVEADLNRIFMSYSLPRMDYYRRTMISASGDLGTLQYYGTAAAVLFLFLCGLPAAPLVHPSRGAFDRKLRLLGIGPASVAGVKIAATAVLLLIPAIGLLAGAVAAGWASFSLLWAFALLLVCCVSSAYIVFIYELTRSQMAGVMALFLSVFLMFFLSGAFVPSVFLPEGLRRVGLLMPSGWLVSILRAAAAGEWMWGPISLTAAFGAALYGAVVWIRSAD